MVVRPSASDRLANQAAFLSRSDLAELGLERRAIDAIFRALPVVAFPGYSRPLIRVSDYLKLLDQSTYRGDGVPPGSTAADVDRVLTEGRTLRL